MKPRLTNSILALCALTLTPVIASAQENNPPKPPPPPGDGPRREQKHRNERGPGDQFKPVEMRPTAFIGVITREMAADVRAQAGVREGFGLLVIDVMPDGPAKAAGLQEHDVLVMLDDQKLVNMEQLSALVRAQKKGDEITLTIKRAGAEQKIKVTVGERDMPPPMPQMERNRYDMPQPPFGDDWRERADRFQNQMREYQDRVQDWTRGDRNRPQPPPPQQKDGPGRDGFRRPPTEERKSSASTESSVSSSTSITEDGGEKVTMHGSVMRRDDTGVYSLTRQNDKATFTARDKDGKEQSWPINTPQEREAVPAELREKLRELEKVQIDSKAEIRRGEAPGK